MLNRIKIYLNDAALDGGPAASSVDTAPASEPVSTPAPATLETQPAAQPATTVTTEPSQPASQPAEAVRIVDSMPDLQSPEFTNAYHALTPEQRVQADAEIDAIYKGTAPAQGQAQQQAASAAAEAAKKSAEAADPTPTAAENEIPDGEVASYELESLEKAASAIPAETLKGLPQEVQEAIKAGPRIAQAMRDLDQRYQEVAIYSDPVVKRTMETITTDPVILGRLEELRTGKVFKAPEALISEFKSADHVAPAVKDIVETVKGLLDDDLGPEENSKIVSAIEAATKSAFEKGIQLADTHAKAREALRVQEVAFKADFEREMLAAASKYPELKSDDPKISIWDDRHPLKKIVDFATAKKMSTVFLDGTPNPGEVVIAAYLAATGGLQKTFKNVSANAIKSVIRNVERAATQAATTVGRATSVAPTTPKPVLPGVDMNRYAVDPNYRQELYLSALTRGDGERVRALDEAERALYKQQ